ncbi:unnamed protein product, partial [Pylaiella littoralis]
AYFGVGVCVQIFAFNSCTLWGRHSEHFIYSHLHINFKFGAGSHCLSSPSDFLPFEIILAKRQSCLSRLGRFMRCHPCRGRKGTDAAAEDGIVSDWEGLKCWFVYGLFSGFQCGFSFELTDLFRVPAWPDRS